MSNDEIVPVRHTTMSAFGTKATEAVGGGLKGTLRGGLRGAGFGILIGGALAFGVGMFIFGGWGAALISAAEAAALAPSFSWTALAVGVTTLVGAIGGAVTGLGAGAGIGGLFGAGRGFQEGRQRVNMERGAAQMMDMDFANAQMQLIAAAQQPRQTGTAAPGSRYNQAAPTVDAGSLAREGMIAGQPQLQRA